MKKLLCLILIICILSSLITMLPITVSATVSGSCGTNLVWAFDDNQTLTISGTGEMDDWSSLNEIPWYSFKDKILNIVIDNNVTSISKDAFYGTAYYNNPDNWENGVLYIGSYLIDAKSVEKCTIKEGTTYIGDYAFSYCIGLKEINIPNSVKSIGKYAFYNCAGLQNIIIPDSVVRIGKYAFYSCTGLSDIAIPYSVSYIGDEAFSFCTNLKNITADKNSLYYSSVDGILFDKAKTKLIRYPENRTRDIYYLPYSVTEIGVGAFSGCKGVGRVIIPNSVTRIGDNAFFNCSEMVGISIPLSVASIGKRAFYNTGYYNISGNWEGGILYIDKYLIAANSAEELTVKDGTVCIADGAFKDCEDLIRVTIPKTVTSIGNNAFSGCEKLISINIPSNVTSIGAGTFYDCTALMSISIPISVKSIGVGAFYHCNALAGVFYAGNEAQWKNIAFSTYNEYLTSKKIYYNYDLIPEGFVFEENTTEPFGGIPEELLTPEDIEAMITLEIEQALANQMYEEGMN